MDANTITFLTSIAGQIPLVGAFAWFVLYLLKYTAEQNNEKDRVWGELMEGMRSDYKESLNRLLITIEQSDQRWRDFVGEQNERHRAVLKEIEVGLNEVARRVSVLAEHDRHTKSPAE